MNNLNYEIDSYRNMHIHADRNDFREDKYQNLLTDLLSLAVNLKCDLVWLKIPINKSHLIPDAVRFGFEFYYCSNDYLLLVIKIVGSAILPLSPSHFVGVGGIVLDNKFNLLVVKNKTNIEDKDIFFKLPGGNLENNEHFSDGIIREVYEETGIDTEFMWLSSIAHLKQWRLNKSNIYMICRLKPLNNVIKIDPIEIAECKWMPVEEYLSAKNVSKFNKHIIKSAINLDNGMKLHSVDEYLVELENEGFQGSRQNFELLSL